MNRMDGLSMNIEKEARERLQSVFPECFSEGTLDIDKLLTMCGEYITNDFEKYKFEWNGKGEAMMLAQRRSAACLRPCKEESVNFDTTQNLYIEGDNLEVLKLLQTAYFRQVKMIYIDPPYNTGHDFVYEDDFKDPLAHYLEVTSQATKSNPETMGRFHTAWLNMMYPRLRLAANLLRDDGVIFISIDDNEVTNLRKLCDEVFGEENFVAQIVWRRTDNQPNIGNLARVKEYVICYAKSKNNFSFSKLPLTEKAKNEYRYEDEKGKFRRAILLDKTRGRHTYNIKTKSGNILTGPWMIKQEDFIKLEKENGIYWTSGGEEQPYGKIYLHESKGQIPNDFWGIEFGTNQRASLEVKKLFEERLFDFPKPVSLIQTLVTLGTNLTSSDIILDFFSGSATTAHAVMQLNKEDGGNRHFICVQIPELCDEKSEAYKAGYKNICEIGKERIRHAGVKIVKEMINDQADSAIQMQLGNISAYDICPIHDIGFKVFKLDSSNIKFWDGTPVVVGNGQMYFDKVRNVIDGVKDDRPALDVVYELMLKLGVPFTVPIEEKNILGKTVYSVDGDLLLFCLEPGITSEFIEAMADLDPAKIIVAEMGFADDTAMANAHYILQDKGIEIKLV